MCSEGYSTCSVCLCLCVYLSPLILELQGNEADGEQYQRLQCYKHSKENDDIPETVTF